MIREVDASLNDLEGIEPAESEADRISDLLARKIAGGDQTAAPAETKVSPDLGSLHLGASDDARRACFLRFQAESWPKGTRMPRRVALGEPNRPLKSR